MPDHRHLRALLLHLWIQGSQSRHTAVYMEQVFDTSCLTTRRRDTENTGPFFPSRRAARAKKHRVSSTFFKKNSGRAGKESAASIFVEAMNPLRRIPHTHLLDK